MSKKTGNTLFGICPLTTAQAVIFGKWKLMIVYHISRGVNRFCMIKKFLPDCSEAILAKQLRELEEDGIISRQDFCEVPPHVEYSLTDSGEKLREIISLIAQWGMSYIEQFCSPEEPCSAAREEEAIAQ